MKNNIFCNNCGKQGHVFHSCKLPIISNGLIVYRENKNVNDSLKTKNKYEYLMIQRKDTLGYVDFLRQIFYTQQALFIKYFQRNDHSEKMKIKNLIFKICGMIYG